MKKTTPPNETSHTRNIMIDATGVGRNKAGVGVYARNLIEQLVRLNEFDRLFLLVQSDDPDLHYDETGKVQSVKLPSRIFRSRPIRLISEQIFLPLLLKYFKIDLLHSLHYSFPIVSFGTSRIVTIHDMTSFEMPEVHLATKRIYFQTFIKLASKMADKLIFDSYSTEKDFSTRFGRNQGKNRVVHLGKSDLFRADLDQNRVSEIRIKYGLPEKYILYVGTIEPRKNLRRLIEAFSSVSARYQEVKLVIAGMKGWMFEDVFEAIGRLPKRDQVVLTSFVPEEDKPYLFAGATLFAYPSLYEGFGIPVLEALACGTPTVTSNVSSLPEIAGSAARLVDPRNAAEIAEALSALLSDEECRSAMRKKSIAQAKLFSWENTARETLQIYREISERTGEQPIANPAKIRPKPQAEQTTQRTGING